MNRPPARRTLLVALAGACLAGTTLPAAAQVTPVDVSYLQEVTGRQFSVRNLDDDGAFTSIDFTGADRTEAFRTVVEETNRLVGSGGYQVNARMTNLYLADDSADGFDHSVFVPSKDVSVSFGAQPLSALATLPVVPNVQVSGTLKTCSDAGVAGVLGIAPLPLVTDVLAYATALLNLSDPLVKQVCRALGDAAGTQVDVTVDGVQRTVEEALALADLPFSLSGGQGGAFAEPSYEGDIASLDPAPGSAAPTAKRLMTGTPNTVSGLTDGLADALDAALGTVLAGAGEVGLGSDALTELSTVRTALSSQLSAVTTALGPLEDSKELALLQDLVFTLLPVDLSSLTTSTASYVGYPVLQVAPTATRAGTYRGTLVVDFFETR